MGEQQGRERVRDLLAGKTVMPPVRGEIWPLPVGGAAEELLAIAKELAFDFCFFDQAPGCVDKAHSLGLAAGAVVNGPWQRWMIELGWEQAMLKLGREPDSVRQGLTKATAQVGLEIAVWVESGVDMILLADDIAYSAGPYMSPQQFASLLFPFYKELQKQVAATGLSGGFHSDGQMDLLLPFLKQAGFEFYSLEPEGTDPIRAWQLLGFSVPLFSGLPAAWLMPGGFLPNREGALLTEWLAAGPLIVGSACGLYHVEAKLSLQGIYAWLNAKKIIDCDLK
jgi:uroporphyrinogen decarboxylase